MRATFMAIAHLTAYVPSNGWYRRALAGGMGRIRVGGAERDVWDPALQPTINVGYHAKHDRYGPHIVGTVTEPAGYDVTLQIIPVD